MSNEFTSIAQHPVIYAALLIVLLGFNAFYLSPTWLYYQYFRWFRRTPLNGKEMLYGIHPLGITLQMTSLETKTNWDFFNRVRETRNGFLLYVGRNFYWLPKSGFASAEEIDQCRELIRANVKKISGLRPI